MKKFSITKHYISRTEKESINRKDLNNAAWVEFTNGEKIEIDEGLESIDGHLYASSYVEGIFGWDDASQQYIHRYHMGRYDMGQVKCVVWEVPNEQ